jgi:hypothetical protein
MRHGDRAREELLMPAWAWAVLVPLFIIGIAGTAGGVAGMLFQNASKAVSPEGVSYQVDIGPKGLPWIGTFNWNMSWLTSPFHWIRFLRQHPRSYSVSVAKIENRNLGPDLVNESFESYTEARSRYRELRSQIQAGAPAFTNN